MCDYVIVTDSTCDLPQAIVDQLNINVIPMGFTIGDQAYLNYTDERELSTKEFYNLLRKGNVSMTSQVSVQRYLDEFENILQEGHDIIYLCFSSALSGSFNASNVAANDLLEKKSSTQTAR